ncbi:TPA: type 1 fimbrial protein [Providencia stuartii]|nr:type 1 fimbrial protein [Providencia stuartii]
MGKLLKRTGVYALSCCLLGSILSFGLSSSIFAAPKQLGERYVDNWGVDGQHGILRVRGTLTDSPCRLSMRTADQTIDLGSVAVGDLPHIGAKGQGVTFQLELTNCLAVENARMDRQTGQVPWSKDEPGVAIRFVSADTDESGRYALLKGTSGLGLVIQDAKGEIMPLSQYAPPILLPAGQSILTYRVFPVRLDQRVYPAAFSGVIGFQLSYD